MTEKNPSKKEPFFSGSLPPAMLEEILQRIDENLVSRPLLSQQTEPGVNYERQFNHLPLPPLPPDLLEKITIIRNAQAPYYVVSGNPVARFIKSLHNLVLKLFGRKQAYFNNLTLDLLEALAAYVTDLQEHNKSQSILTNALAGQLKLQMEQFSALQTDYQHLVTQVKKLAIKNDEIPNPSKQGEQPTAEQGRIRQRPEGTKRNPESD